MKTRKIFFLQILILFVLLFGTNINAQNPTKWNFSSNVGIGFDEQRFFYFASAAELERFFTNRLSCGLGFNQISSFRNQNNRSLRLENCSFESFEKDRDRLANIWRVYLELKYYPVKSEKFWFSIGVGGKLEFLDKREIIPVDDDTKSQYTISQINSIAPWFISNINFTYFVKKNIGIDFLIPDIIKIKKYSTFLIGTKILF